MAAPTTLTLSADEALVLFELLSRWSEDHAAARPSGDCFESPAEVGALLGVLACLESQLTEPLQANYADLLAAARARLVARVGNDLAL